MLLNFDFLWDSLFCVLWDLPIFNGLAFSLLCGTSMPLPILSDGDLRGSSDSVIRARKFVSKLPPLRPLSFAGCLLYPESLIGSKSTACTSPLVFTSWSSSFTELLSSLDAFAVWASRTGTYWGVLSDCLLHEGRAPRADLVVGLALYIDSDIDFGRRRSFRLSTIWFILWIYTFSDGL